MIFKQIKETGSPIGEVLAINSSGYMLVGYVHKTKDGRFTCEDENTNLENVVAYIPCSQLRLLNELQTSIPE